MKNRITLLVFCLALCLALVVSGIWAAQPKTASAASSACVPGPHGGDITYDQTWCHIDSPHYVTFSINVKAGVTLTIEPGVIIYITTTPAMTVFVNGTLNAVGASDQPITITSAAGSPAPGDWGGIGFASGSHGILAYTDISYGGAGAGSSIGLAIHTSDVQVLHSRIHHIKNWPVVIDGTSLAPVFEDVEIDHNADLYPLKQSTITQHPSYTDVWLHDNGVDALWIPPSSVSEDVTLDGNMTALNGAPIYFDGGNVNVGKTLTIIPGTTIKFGGNRGLNVVGSLMAEGTSALPIIFTSQAATPQPGDWAAISMSSGSHGRLAYCEVAYAGGPGGSNRGISVESSDVQVRHCRIHHTYGVPLDIQGVGLAPVFEDIEIDHNPGDNPLRQSTIAQNPSYTNIRLHDNGTNALIIPLSTVDRDVTLDGSPTALNGAPVLYEGGTVNIGKTLTITPGTVIKFAGNRALTVNGSLLAEGTALLPIAFTSRNASPAPGDWASLDLKADSHVRLAYCDVSYGGAAGGSNRGINIEGSDIQVRHCRIHHTLLHAVHLQGAGITPILEDIEIDHNPSSTPLYQSTIAMHPSYTDLLMHDNDLNALIIPLSNVDRDVTLDGSPTALNGAPVHYDGGTVNATRTLTITPGTTLKLVNPLTVNGTLLADGTGALPIVFTSRSATPAPGNWGPIGFESGSSGHLSHCEVAYSGSTGGGQRGVRIRSSNVQIQSCRIHHSLGYALSVESGAQVTMHNMVISDNANRGINLQDGSHLDGSHFTLARNGSGAVLTGATTTLTLVNSIAANNTLGINAGSSVVSLDHTLWDGNTTDFSGAVSETWRFTGAAGFAGDGYHITVRSAATGVGLVTSLATDIDGNARPLPALSLPDLGADEIITWEIRLPLILR